MDISIKNAQKENCVIGIEIEHKADASYPFQNIEKMKSWCHNSIFRQCGLMQIFNEDSNISHNKIEELVRFARDNQQKNCGFYYDFVFYRVNDNRTTKQTAEEFVNSLDFKTRLWTLMGDINIF